MMKLNLDEMRRLIGCNGAWFEYTDRANKIGSLFTKEGRWEWSNEQDCYLLVD